MGSQKISSIGDLYQINTALVNMNKVYWGNVSLKKLTCYIHFLRCLLNFFYETAFILSRFWADLTEKIVSNKVSRVG